MPPIFQPEVAARGIHYAAHADRREVWVGYSTAGTILGNRASSAALDRYLSNNAVSGQKTDQDAADNRPDNLFEPADADTDFGIHGPFDGKSKSRSAQLFATRNRGKLAAAGVALTATAIAAMVRRASWSTPR